MIIQLHSKLYNNPKILDAIETHFCGPTVDKPDIICSEDDITAVCSNDDSIEAAQYVISIRNYLEKNYYVALSNL